MDKAFTDFLQDMVTNDVNQINIPEDVLKQIVRLNEIREEIDPNRVNDLLVPFLLTRQTEIVNAQLLIGRHLSLMKGTQNYAYIFRKFKTAQDFNPTKKRLEVARPSKRPTVGEIDSELEKGMVTVRKTETAYQVAGDKLMCLDKWCDKMMMIIQNRLRDENTVQRTTYAGNNAPQYRP